MADSALLRGPVTVANLTAAAGVTTTVDGWWPCLDITFRTPVPPSITKITAQVRERGSDAGKNPPIAEQVLTSDELAAGEAKLVNGVSVGQHLEVRLVPAGAPGLPFQPTPWVEVTTSWDALMAALDGLLVGCVKIVCGEGEPTRTDLPVGSLYIEESAGQVWQYVADKEVAVQAVNISGPNLKSSGGTNAVSMGGFDAGKTVRFSKPLAADSDGLLTWDAASYWPDDSGTTPTPSPVPGHTWDNSFTIYGNNGGSDTLLWATSFPGFYATAADAFDALVAVTPVQFSGYVTYKVVGTADPNPSDNRGGLSVKVEELTPGWVKKSDLTSMLVDGVEVEAGPRSVNFVGATVTTDDEHNVTVEITAGSPGGSSGQIQYNNAGAFGGFTMSGDGTLNTGTGALTVTKTSGVSFGYFATGADAANLTGTVSVNRFNSGTGASSSTFLRGDGIWATPSATVTFSASSRVLGRKTSGAGASEELTLSEMLDFIGSAAQGDILYRGSSSWARRAAGSAGQYLKTQGAGADPIWDTPSSAGTLPLLTIVRRSTNQSINNNTSTDVSWDTTVVRDDVGAFSSGSPTLVTVPSGYTKARISVQTNWASSSTGVRYNVIIKNGSNYAGSVTQAANETALSWSSVWVTVATGDVFKLNIYQNSGGALNFRGGSANFGDCYMQFEWAA